MSTSPSRISAPLRLQSISKINHKYEKPMAAKAQIHVNENPLIKVPELMRTMIHGKPEARVHSGKALMDLSEKEEMRRPLVMIPHFIETLCSMLFLEEKGQTTNDLATKRIKQHALSIINNLLLEDPAIDSYIVNEESFLPGVVKALHSTDLLTQEIVCKTLDYISVDPAHQTLICGTEHMLRGFVHLLRSTKSTIARSHALQALLYLSSNQKNQFIMAREEGMLDELGKLLLLRDESAVSAMRVIHNLTLLCNDNIILVSKDKKLMQRLRSIVDEGTVERLKNSTEDLINMNNICSSSSSNNNNSSNNRGSMYAISPMEMMARQIVDRIDAYENRYSTTGAAGGSGAEAATTFFSSPTISFDSSSIPKQHSSSTPTTTVEEESSSPPPPLSSVGRRPRFT